MTIPERIKARRIELNLSADDVASKIGKDRATIYRYESNEIKKLPTSVLEPLAAALETTPAYLMGWGEQSSANGKPDNIIPLPIQKRIPLLGSIACGEPILAEENVEDYITSPDKLRADFALRCRGDSMINARIYNNDIVYIRQQPDVENGEIAAVLIGDEATLKRVYHYADMIILRAENPAVAELIYTNEQLNDIRILGKAVALFGAVM